MVKEITQEEISINVRLACKTLQASRSGYYAWLKRKASKRATENVVIVAEIKRLHQASRKACGSPRITQALKQQGIQCSENRVAKLMQLNGIRSCVARRYKPATLISEPTLRAAERVFEVEHASASVRAPNKAWCADITYVETKEGWLFTAAVLDVFTRKIVGHATSNTMSAELVEEAMEMALGRQVIKQGNLIAHSDQGSQYASWRYRSLLVNNGIVASMSRRGNCYDNAYIESFFKTFKAELVYQQKFETRNEAKSAIFEWIEVFYNRQRLHSSINYLTPDAFEKMTLAA